MVDTNILLVDDDKDLCASMSDIFLGLGYSVNMANSGSVALNLSYEHQYRLALLDFKMPEMDGLELCRRLKAHQPSIIVALVTAYASAATTVAADEAGVRRILLKPVDFLLLLPFVKETVGTR